MNPLPPIPPIPKIDTTLILEVDKRNLCSTLLRSVKAFYENPENRKRFEAWKREHDKQKMEA